MMGPREALMFAARAAAVAVRREIDDGIPSMRSHSPADLVVIRVWMTCLSRALDALAVGKVSFAERARRDSPARSQVAQLLTEAVQAEAPSETATTPTGGADEKA